MTLKGNTFNIDVKELYYNVSIDHLYFQESPLVYYQCSNSTVIGNRFEQNQIDPNTAWITYYNNDGINCLSENIFTNFAIYAYGTDVTSCFRLNLVDCIRNNSNICSNGIYGNIDPDLFNHGTSILVSGGVDQIIRAHDSNIALDNINITVINAYTDNPIIVKVNNAKILLIDSYITSNYDISYYGGMCNVINNNRLSTNIQYISELLMDCPYYAAPLYLNKTMNSAVTNYVDHLSGVQLDLTAKLSSYYPGQLLTFNYNILDKIDNILQYNSSNGFAIALQGDIFSTEIEIKEDGECPLCETGILITSISIQDNINEDFIVSISIIDDTFYSSNDEIHLDIIGCPVMFGPGDNNYTCIPCNTDYYNIIHDNVEICKSCDPHNNQNAKCIGGDINIEREYWMGFHDDIIISSICPHSQCCQEENGCHYLKNKQVLCALNRDYKSKLCSRCMRGYSESMNSTNCVQCKRLFYWEYLLYPMSISLFWILYLMITTSDKIKNRKRKKHGADSKCCNCCSKCSKAVQNFKVYKSLEKLLSNNYLMLMLQTILNVNIMYYEQALSQILSQGSYLILFTMFIQIFNFSFITNNNNNEGASWCFIDGLTSKQKILFDLVIPLIISFYLCALYVISKWNYDGQLTLCGKRKINFTKTLIAMVLLIIGNILSVLFRLMNCSDISSYSAAVHFYFAYEECYGLTWFSTLASVIIIIIIFSFVFIKLKTMHVLQRQNDDNIWNSFVSKYKPKYYYWEYIIFVRRICIAMFSVSTGDGMTTFIFIVVIALFLWSHIECQPFLIYDSNKLEGILLICLIFVIVLKILSIEDNYKKYIISFLIFLPFILMIYYIYKFKMNKNKNYNFTLKQQIKYLILCIIAYYTPYSNTNQNKNGYLNIDEFEEKSEDDEKKLITQMTIRSDLSSAVSLTYYQSMDANDSQK